MGIFHGHCDACANDEKTCTYTYTVYMVPDSAKGISQLHVSCSPQHHS